MRLWNERLIPILDRQRLLGQHRECCAMRGKGWGKKHSTVDWAFKHNPYSLYAYHERVMGEMEDRGYNVDPLWKNVYYRGKRAEPWNREEIVIREVSSPIYPEHGGSSLQDDIALLLLKLIETNDDIVVVNMLGEY